MTDLRDLLQRHVDFVEKKPVDWGETDCTMWPARWVEAVKGIRLDLPPYSSEGQARALIAEAGSLADLWTGALNGVLAERYGEPEFGDVGVIVSRLYGQFGGIFGDDRIFFWRSVCGTGLLRPRRSTIVKVWALF